MCVPRTPFSVEEFESGMGLGALETLPTLGLTLFGAEETEGPSVTTTPRSVQENP